MPYVGSQEFINFIRDGKGDSFRKRYREMDILMVDDVQFLTGQDPTAGRALPPPSMRPSCTPTARSAY
ncbi:DnaA ATPase domain-containing protein [Streptomyces chartreusis]|uniref:DnaA ATPase domain-containing protein n=1 Tax=Streptomyces chartreusis TaxID=1969 RepID=UPI0019ADC2A0|nr:hypothetical protein GCM10010321_34090 [Streptomyces chartreusis]